MAPIPDESEEQVHPPVEPSSRHRGVTSDELETTLAALRRLKSEVRSVVVLRLHTDMSRPQFAEALHRALADLWKEPS